MTATTSKVSSILSSNTKIALTPAGIPAVNSGISLAPAKRSGHNVCKSATPGCIKACVLWFAGRTLTAAVRGAALARTALLFGNPAEFHARLDKELTSQERAAAAIGARSFCRPNAASDLDYGIDIARRHPETTFYDYSKVRQRVRDYAAGKLPSNYHVSYSIHENSEYSDVAEFLRSGVNVVMVVDSYYWGPSKRYGRLPEEVTFTGPNGESITVDTVDGDIQDIRIPEFDGHGKCIVLRLKSQSKAVKQSARDSGFARYFEFGGKEYSERGAKPALQGRMVASLK
jgi:hypothetical protein